jgi:hypothetical protein
VNQSVLVTFARSKATSDNAPARALDDIVPINRPPRLLVRRIRGPLIAA